MHDPRPYGLAVLGGELTEKDQSMISATVLRFTNAKQLGQLDSLKNQHDLPDGGYFIIQDMGGIFKVVAYKPETPKPFELDGMAHDYIPMLFSGVFGRHFFTDDGKWLSVKITEQCRKRLANYDPNVVIAKNLELERFAIGYSDKFKYLEPRSSGPYFRHSQYMRIKPTLYSGAMTEVMQIISGYGRPFDEKYKDHPNEKLENAQLRLPDNWKIRIDQEIKSQILPGYSGFPNTEGFIQYDYKPSSNDLVAFDFEKNPWLVRIQSGGVYAMPLPVIPATATQTFREYIADVGDDEILKILDRFKAMPSGETFPSGSDFETWKRAGVIIKVCDTSDFFQYQPLYGACGWSINSTGTEAFNTCYTYSKDGMMQAYGYKLTLKLAAMTDKGWIGSRSSNTEILSAYLGSLFSLLDKTEAKAQAITYKIRRVEIEELISRAQQRGGKANQDDVDYWDNYESKPIANHSGSMSRTTSGAVYWPYYMRPQPLGSFKFPTLSGEGCESLPITSPEYRGDFVKSDTVLFGAYINDQLHYVKFFCDAIQINKETDSTFEQMMIVGRWESNETKTPSGLSGYFYTSDFDDRRLASPTYTKTSIVGTDLGYGNPLFSTPPLLFMEGGLSRARYYKHVTITEYTTGESMDCAICIPNFNRDCILYAFRETTQSKSRREKHEVHAMADPTSYKLWTYDPGFHWMGDAGKGLPYPTTGNYVYISGPPRYNPTEFSDFADSGDWFGVGGGYVDVSAICAPYTDRASSKHNAGGARIGGEGPDIEPFDVTEIENDIQRGRVDIAYGGVDAKTIHKSIPDEWYFYFSPEIGSNPPRYFERDACRVSFGDITYANISNENATRERRQRWGFSSLADNTSHHYFIGVINE
ncbi:hypothetical protein [Acinetobacter sp. YH12036]|uniref:hypothetical protein n=1 Tax=Acinetobacter sp. YH12036 TaxID=2601046 RepID=UPI0015D339D6|nr:hypothetical protein [Acinetobacter sp. YH12036]